MKCTVCDRACASEFGLLSHMRSHLKVDDLPGKPTDAPEEKPIEGFKTVKSAPGFVLKVSGDMAVIENDIGQRLSKPMPVGKAERIYDRFRTSTR